MSELALKLIAENKAKYERGEDASYLEIGNCGLIKLPKEIGELSWLKVLILSNEWDENDEMNIDAEELYPISSPNEGPPNYIKSLKGLEQLINLQKLIVTGSITQGRSWISLKDLSPLSGLSNLKELLITSTGVDDLSPIRNLLELEQLDIASTKVFDLTPIEKLHKLKRLNCYNTKVVDITPLQQLKRLNSIWLHSTSINNISPLSDLNKLIEINLSNTKVTDLRPIRNLIEKKIKVHWNDLGFGIKVYKCPLVNPPPEVIKQGNAAILQYFDELEKAKAKGETIRLSEAKCLILGEGGAGKTSLAKKLLNTENELPEEQATTKGIDVYPHDLKLYDGTDFRLNIWDFGGQEIYHATHQFFLTKRSIYILLDDTRKDEKTVNDPSFNYWLQVAQLYGGNSPLLIVQNEKGDRSKQLDLKGMQGRFGFVKDAKATNLLTCRGLNEVWTAIEYWLKQLPHIGEEQPKAWVDIRRELEQLAREEGRDHIPLEEYYRICAQHDIPERERALFLSSYLHDFGAFLHFQDHPLLRKTLVLNNQWATDAVYKVLDCEEVKGSFGRFNRSTLGRIWADDRYADQHDELLALMEKFELCYKLPDERADTWLAPQLLSVLQPEALNWDDSDNLQFRYEYEFMPKGLLSQHIVRNHRYIRQTELAWKSGAVFERAGAQALVTEAWGSRNIRICARGTNAKELLTLLSEDFDKMHERLEGLKVRKMIPCNCQKCAKNAEPHFYDYEKLQRRRMDGKRTVECDLSYEDVSVVGLLDGVFAKVIETNHTLNQPTMTAKKVFISYSHKDETLKEELDTHLSALKRTELVDVWQDRIIDAGTEWDDEIKAELEAADIILLLVSANFLASKYIWEVEIAHAMERHHAKTARVIPIFLRACDMKGMPFEKIQGLPRDAKPVVSFSDKDEAYLQIAKGIRSVLEK